MRRKMIHLPPRFDHLHGLKEIGQKLPLGLPLPETLPLPLLKQRLRRDRRVNFAVRLHHLASPYPVSPYLAGLKVVRRRPRRPQLLSRARLPLEDPSILDVDPLPIAPPIIPPPPLPSQPSPAQLPPQLLQRHPAGNVTPPPRLRLGRLPFRRRHGRRVVNRRRRRRGLRRRR